MVQRRTYVLWICVVLGCFALWGQSGAPVVTNSPAREVPRKTVEGTVVNSLTGEPLRRALVTMSGVSQRFAFTDDEGRFSFENVPVASESGTRVVLQATRPGFFAHYDRPTFVDLAKAGDDVKLELIPAAVISGQVLGADDQPLEHVPVEVLEAQIQEGRKRWNVRNRKMTDEDGVFRIAGLKPGTYKISAGPLRNRDLQAAGLGYGATFFPNALDRNSAGLVRLAPAQNADIHFKLRPVSVYRVSGMVTGQFTGGAGVNVFDASNVPVQVPARMDFATGAFEMMLPPGRYTIRAMANDGHGQMLRAKVSIAVGSDITGLTLALDHGLTVPVVVRREFTKTSPTQGAAGSQQANAVGASVRLFLASDGELAGGGYSMPGQAPDNAVISNLEPGTYEAEVVMQGAWSGNIYIASLQCGTKDLFREPLTITGSSEVNPIEVVMRDDGARVEGTVRGGGADGGQLIIVSDTQPKRTLMGRYGPGGQLQSQALAPGAYTLYAFDSGEQIEYTNPEVLERYRAKAGHVSVSANQTARVTLDLIETQP